MEDCIFCKIAKGEIPSWKVYEDESTYAFFDINPKNEYHTLVIPKKHYKDIFEIPEDEAASLMRTVKKVVDLYGEKLGHKDVQILNNSGENAQQDVFHIHFHIIPRFPGDGQNAIWPKTRKEVPDRFAELMKRIEQ